MTGTSRPQPGGRWRKDRPFTPASAFDTPERRTGKTDVLRVTNAAGRVRRGRGGSRAWPGAGLSWSPTKGRTPGARRRPSAKDAVGLVSARASLMRSNTRTTAGRHFPGFSKPRRDSACGERTGRNRTAPRSSPVRTCADTVRLRGGTLLHLDGLPLHGRLQTSRPWPRPSPRVSLD